MKINRYASYIFPLSSFLVLSYVCKSPNSDILTSRAFNVLLRAKLLLLCSQNGRLAGISTFGKLAALCTCLFSGPCSGIEFDSFGPPGSALTTGADHRSAQGMYI